MIKQFLNWLRAQQRFDREVEAWLKISYICQGSEYGADEAGFVRWRDEIMSGRRTFPKENHSAD